MQSFYTEQQKILSQTARDFSLTELSPKASEVDENENIPIEQFQALSNLGFTIIQKEFIEGDYLYIIENNDNKFVVRMNNSEEFYLNEMVGVVIKDTNVQIIDISL